MIKDTTGIIQAGASATPANNFTLDASAANGTAKLYSGNAGTPVNTVLTVDATGGLTPMAPMHLAAVTPIFSAYQSVAQTLTAGSYARVNFQSILFDTTNAFDNVINMRFTPLVAGYYQVNANTQAASAGEVEGAIYKNGVNPTYGPYSSNSFSTSNSALIYMNGTSDYIEYMTYSAAGATLLAWAGHTYFQAALIARV